MALATGEGQESLGREGVKYKGWVLYLHNLAQTLHAPASMPVWLTDARPKVLGAKTRVMVMHGMACASERRVPKGRFPA